MIHLYPGDLLAALDITLDLFGLRAVADILGVTILADFNIGYPGKGLSLVKLMAEVASEAHFLDMLLVIEFDRLPDGVRREREYQQEGSCGHHNDRD